MAQSKLYGVVFFRSCTARLLCAVFFILLYASSVHAAGLRDDGFIIRVPMHPPEDQICVLPLQWRTERILMPYPKTPLAVDEKGVYTGNDNVYALDRTTGDILWTFKMPEVDYDVAFRSEGINALRIDSDTVYFGGYAKALYAIDKRTGQERWHHEVNGSVKADIALDDKHVYLTAQGVVYALEKATGKLVWQFELATQFSATGPVLNGNRLYVFSGRYAFALDKDTGEQVWKTRINEDVTFNTTDTPPYFYQGQIMGGATGSIAVAFDAETGQQLWTFSARGLWAYGVGLGKGSEVIINSKIGQLARFDIHTHEVKWWFAPYLGKTFMPPIVYKNLVMQGNDLDYVYAVNLDDGEEVFRFPLDEDTRGLRALVVHGNNLYATGINGKVQAYRLQCPQLENRTK